MSDFFSESATVGVVISFLMYYAGLAINKKTKLAILNPLLLAIIGVIAFLLIFNIDYEVYNSSAKYLSYLLTPATVCLAIPMYQKLELLKKEPIAILSGIVSGVIASLLSVFALSLVFGLSHEQYVTLLPKSITTAIGMGVSEELGGMAVITTASIIITGIFGNIAADLLWRVFRITDPISKGISIGTAAHAFGTAKALETGETEGAMSSLSIVVSGLCTVVLANIFSGLI